MSNLIDFFNKNRALLVISKLKLCSFSFHLYWLHLWQCYDKYLQQSLCRASKLRGHSFWGKCPDNAGQYNSRPHETGFFCERGDYDSYYGRFFLHWYAQTLIDHADNVLSLASLAFDEIKIIIKVSIGASQYIYPIFSMLSCIFISLYDLLKSLNSVGVPYTNYNQ